MHAWWARGLSSRHGVHAEVLLRKLVDSEESTPHVGAGESDDLRRMAATNHCRAGSNRKRFWSRVVVGRRSGGFVTEYYADRTSLLLCTDDSGRVTEDLLHVRGEILRSALDRNRLLGVHEDGGVAIECNGAAGCLRKSTEGMRKSNAEVIVTTLLH